MLTEPFTYFLHWTKVGKSYYGVKYAEGCQPTDLWKTYFTSSAPVAALRAELGEPDIVEVRKKFRMKSQAILWEHKVLRRLKVCSREDYLNQSSGVASGNYQRTPQHRERLSEWAIENDCVKNLQAHNFTTERSGNFFWNEGTKKKISESRKAYLKENPPTGKRNPFYGKQHTEEFKLRQRKLKGKKISCEGVVYDSVKFAAESMSVSRGCINYRLKTREDYYDI